VESSGMDAPHLKQNMLTFALEFDFDGQPNAFANKRQSADHRQNLA
jgi:hypothetical protein